MPNDVQKILYFYTMNANTENNAWQSRTTLLIGEEKLHRLQQSTMLVVGLGGVGSFAAEFLVRAGVGKLCIVDGDVVDPSNRNRQLPALYSTQGKAKALVMKDRLLDINPNLKLEVVQAFLIPETFDELLQQSFDFVLDCIDSVTPKLSLIEKTLQRKYPLVSSMGAGGKMDPTLIKVADISMTYNCPFAQQVRKRLKKQNIYSGFETVFSPEVPDPTSLLLTDGSNFKKSAYGTISYIPAAFGGVCASVAIRSIIQWQPNEVPQSPYLKKQKKKRKQK